jgi:hypothetical protein
MDKSAEPANPERELPIAFAGDDGSVVVNFGILTGREATQAEIDRLAQSLHTRSGAEAEITISAVRRQDYGHGVETVSHQVHVWTKGSQVPEIEAICHTWAVSCAEDRRVAPLGL